MAQPGAGRNRELPAPISAATWQAPDVDGEPCDGDLVKNPTLSLLLDAERVAVYLGPSPTSSRRTCTAQTSFSWTYLAGADRRIVEAMRFERHRSLEKNRTARQWMPGPWFVAAS